MSDAVGRDDHDNIRRFARSQDGRFAKRADSVFGPIAAGLVTAAGHIGAETGLRATLTKHLGNLDESPPLFAETLAAMEAGS